MQANVTKMSTYGLDVGSAGKKPHQKKRGKKSKRAESFVTERVDRLQRTADVQQPVKLKIIRRNGQHEVSGGSVNPFSLVFLSDHTCVTTCTGCSRRFARIHLFCQGILFFFITLRFAAVFALISMRTIRDSVIVAVQGIQLTLHCYVG